MGIRTDLALETVKLDENVGLAGVKENVFVRSGCKISEVVISDENSAKKIGKPLGSYVTMEFEESRTLDAYPENLEGDAKILAKEISKFLPEFGDILVVGLGNDDITPDALGPLATKRIFATRHIKDELAEIEEFNDLRGVCAISPNVLGNTGIESAEIIKAVCKKIKPSAVIVIDALACSEIERLGRTIQLSNTGISPGSGVKNKRKELSEKTLGCPVISIGVPTVIDMHTIAETIFNDNSEKTEFSQMMVTPRFVDKLIENSAKIISVGVNFALQPDMTIADILSLTS